MVGCRLLPLAAVLLHCSVAFCSKSVFCSRSPKGLWFLSDTYPAMGIAHACQSSMMTNWWLHVMRHVFEGHTSQ